jgi:hypothetical protein
VRKTNFTRHLSHKEGIINKQKIWSKNTEGKRHFKKTGVKEVLKKHKLCCGLYSAGSEYGQAVNAALNTLKGGEFLNRLRGCKFLKKYCPLRK